MVLRSSRETSCGLGRYCSRSIDSLLSASASTAVTDGATENAIRVFVRFALTVDGVHCGFEFLDDYAPLEGEDFGFAEFLAPMDVIVTGRRAFGRDTQPFGGTPSTVRSRTLSATVIPDRLRDGDTVSASSLTPMETVRKLRSEGAQVRLRRRRRHCTQVPPGRARSQAEPLPCSDYLRRGHPTVFWRDGPADADAQTPSDEGAR